MNRNSNFELLVDRLDGLQSASEAKITDSMMAADENVANEYALVESVVAQIREAGIYEQVAGIRNTYKTGNIENETTAKVVQFDFKRILLKVAASVVLILISATIYKYVSVSNSGVYNEYYSTYELNTSRDRSQSDNIETAYRHKEWQRVIEMSAASAPTNKELFLKGMAQLELKNFELAIPAFNQVISQATANADNYFLDEAEYYVALSYLAANQGDKGLTILNKIESDPQHLFYSSVKRMNLDLKVLNIKN